MAPVSQQVWSRKEICRVLSLEERHLKTWERQGLIPPAEQYAFSDLLLLRTLNVFREKKIRSDRIRESLRSIRQRFGVDMPLSQLKVFAEGRRIGVHFSGERMEPVTGQLLLDFDARTEKTRLLQRNTDPPRSKEHADFWFQKGLELEQSGADPKEAVAAYERAVNCNPNAAGALVNLGTIFFHQRDWRRSESYYKAAVEADPKYALAHYNLGNLYDERNDSDRAQFHYHEALRLQPQYADAHYNLALLHQGRGEYMKALSHWQTYLKIDPASQWAQIARREIQKLKQSTIVGGTRPKRA